MEAENTNERRSRTAIFVVVVAHQKVERTYTKSQLKGTQNWQKIISKETSAEEIKPTASDI